MDGRGYYHPSHSKPRPGTNWPLWVILGVFVAGIVGIVWTLGGESPARRAPTAPRATGTAQEPSQGYIDCMALEVGCCYSLSADTPLCAECGQKLPDEKSADRTLLPARSQVGVMKASSVEGVRWYYVQAVGSDGQTKLGIGWVSSDSLKTQSIRFLK